MSKRFIFSILLLSILLLSFPKPASAIIGTGLFDVFDTMLGGVEEKAGPIAEKMVIFFFVYLIGFFTLHVSTWFLQTAMNPELISLQGSPLVETGWQFTVGIANMFIIIILLYIAFSFILKIDNQQMKKAFPRLILVAILLNFSLLFVGMLVDIGNITTNTFFRGNENLPSLVNQSLAEAMKESLWGIGGWLVALAVLFMIPIASPFFQLALVTVVATGGVFLPTFIIWFFQLISAFIISTIFLIYAVLFIARVFIIQLLAIIAPLAFLALILPQTKKYWDKWLHLLLEWVFLGVALFFFMVLGLKAVHQITPESGAALWPGSGYFDLKGYFIYYIFLVIYLVVAFWLSKKTMPTFAQAVIDQAKGLGQMAIGRGLTPLGGAAKRRLQQFAVSQKKREDAMEAEKARVGKVKISPLKGLAMGAGRWTRKSIEGAHRIGGTTVDAAMARNLSKKTDEYEKRYGKDFVGAAKNFSNLRADFDRAAMTLYLEKTKGGKALDKLTDSNRRNAVSSLAKYASYRVEDIIKHMPELISKSEEMTATIQGAMMSGGIATDEKGNFIDKDLQKMKKADVKIGGKTIDELMKNKEGKTRVIRTVLYKKAIDAAKNEDVDNMTDETLSDTDFQEAVVRYKPVNFIRKIGEEKSSKYIQNIAAKMEDLGVEEIAKTNRATLSSAVTNPGFSSIFTLKEKTRKEIEELLGTKTPAAPKAKIVLGTEEEFIKAKEERRKKGQK